MDERENLYPTHHLFAQDKINPKGTYLHMHYEFNARQPSPIQWKTREKSMAVKG